MIFFQKRKVANQKFGTTINGYNLEITLKTAKGMTLFSLYNNDIAICNSVRCLPNSQVFFDSSIDLNGVFMWICPFNNYPYYELFDEQDFIFLTNEELGTAIEEQENE